MKVKMMPTQEKYALTIEEAAKYFSIGEGKLRDMAGASGGAGWAFRNGNRILIKRKMFEKLLDGSDAI